MSVYSSVEEIITFVFSVDSGSLLPSIAVDCSAFVLAARQWLSRLVSQSPIWAMSTPFCSIPKLSLKNHPQIPTIQLNIPYAAYKMSSTSRSQLLGAFAKLAKATISFVMSVRPSVCPSAWNNSVPTVRMFMKFDI
jgi:hypothetical protein